MWTDRSQHAEAISNNTIGYLRIKPDPALYRSVNGLVDMKKRGQVVAFVLDAVQKNVDIARFVVNYPGDVWIGITPKRPLEVDERNVDPQSDEWARSSQAIEFLDWLGEQTITLYVGEDDGDTEVSRGMPMPFSFSLEKWAPKDPDSYAMGSNKEVSGGGFQMPK